MGSVAEPDAEAVLAEINGRNLNTGKLLSTFEDLKCDGSTVSGCWIYTGVMTEEGKNPTMREPKDSLGHGWGFAWPKDTRIIYNRASARPDGTPWSEEKKFMWWDPEKTRVDQQGHQRSRGLSDLSACDTAGSQPALLLPVSGKYPSTSPTSRSCNPAMS